MTEKEYGRPQGHPAGKQSTAADAQASTSLHDFLQQTAERDNPGDVFELESPKMLEANVSGRIWSKLGAMVAYKGQLTFQREGLLDGGMLKAFKRAVSSEMTPLVAIEGNGICYLADRGKQVTVLRLEGDTLNVNGNDLLAFEDSVTYDITMHRRMAGWASGGLFSVRLSGRGLVAVLSHGKPLTLPVRPGEPIITDPNATVAWSEGLSPELKMDLSLRTLLGRGGGETFQMVFEGSGFVVVQPYEETPILVSGG
ncbi:AIM24 family protein [Deinococcus radiophilus]|uniref:AIM24 family protein n=1 Tax=Deinococcus radiophilus TaxID=32062 RepID=A0A431VZJ3_9DEIO|nr:AIM24 family protein [Deinococcus radiophilus]RTR28638.1 AIM24 family protein [Deinococcus radiophilus]UFA51060.1 AIM24 family protein [Deinococcus radiophilus]